MLATPVAPLAPHPLLAHLVGLTVLLLPARATPWWLALSDVSAAAPAGAAA